MLLILLGVCSVACVQAICPLRPTLQITNAAKTQSDGGFKIIINENEDYYTPDKMYTISLQGFQKDNRLKQFKRFTLSINSESAEHNQSGQVGYFQLVPDNLSTFNENCINTISEVNDFSKSKIQVIWRAPTTGSGCVIFTAMVLVSSDYWYAVDDALTKIFCERPLQIKNNTQPICCACDEAKYSLVMEGIWSNKSHPKDFPFSAWLTHFSDLIGASHEQNFSFWGYDQIATNGFRQLAEWGSASGMEAELRTQSNHLRTIIKAAGLWYPNVNTNTTANFRVDRKHPLVSVASMLGPSPDWVVGVSKLNLCQDNCSWVKEAIIDLYPWDAGTDNGISYMSPNSETNPREKMKPITTFYPEDPRSPFYDPTGKPMLPLARMYLQREKIIPRSCDETFLQQVTEFEVTENTEDTSRPECRTTDYSPWTKCSVTCGKGLRMRAREYAMPEKAIMFKCNKQLISKEMCVASIPECPNNESEETTLHLQSSSFCGMTEWSDWSDCSVSCGFGHKMQRRKFKNHADRKRCLHLPLINKDKCMLPACKAESEEIINVECPVSNWVDWSPCSTTCDKGIKIRTRLLLVEPLKQQECSSHIELLQQRPCWIERNCTYDLTMAKDVCMEEAEIGPCRGYYQRWAFNPIKLMCATFIYGGCRGNRNNFLTEEECKNACQTNKSL
ncbi:spondin-1 [Prorops nasuta]|uniref:spondin-1 n=1 Tax=Prorops nasuta TaxID=863751 RepID=UPI0034D01B0B